MSDIQKKPIVDIIAHVLKTKVGASFKTMLTHDIKFFVLTNYGQGVLISYDETLNGNQISSVIIMKPIFTQAQVEQDEHYESNLTMVLKGMIMLKKYYDKSNN
jgi:hypothetical protein